MLTKDIEKKKNEDYLIFQNKQYHLASCIINTNIDLP